MTTSRTLRILAATLLLLAVRGPLDAHARQRPFTAADMLEVVQISGPVTASADGALLAFVLPDLGDEWNVGARPQLGSVHLLAADGSSPDGPEIVGRPGQRSSLPSFSPDRTRVAVHVEGPAGGRVGVWDIASRAMTLVGAHYPGRAWQAPEWAGNERIVYQRPEPPAPDPEPGRVTVLQSTDPTLPGDAFFARERRAGLAIVDLVSGEERSLVEDGSPLERFAVSPDGGHVIVDVAGGEGSALVSLADPGAAHRVGPRGARYGWLPDGRLAWIDEGRLIAARTEGSGVAGGSAAVIDVPFEPASGLAWASGAGHFAALVADPSITDPEIEDPLPGMYTIARPFTDVHVVPAQGGADHNVTAGVTDRIGAPVWSPDGRSLYFVATDNATYEETLYRYDVGSGSLSRLAGGRESYGSLTAVPGGIVAAIQSATAPPDLWRIDSETGARTRLTELNPRLADVTFATPELFHFHDQDGERLGALLFRPPGLDGGVPVVTYVYEKLTPGIHRFQARQQIFATHGYAVLMPNVKVRVGETATSFVKSVVPALADVHAMGFTNGRACLWGGSFGAYATSFVITQTDVFDCAVSRATPPELFRNWASGRDRDSDNIERGQARMGGSPYEVRDRYLSQSAFFHLDRVETPVLITHGQRDLTILHEEGAMMFYALRRLGKEATFVSYRDGDHSLYRHSRADALDVHRRMLEWFDRHLRR